MTGEPRSNAKLEISASLVALSLFTVQDAFVVEPPAIVPEIVVASIVSKYPVAKRVEDEPMLRVLLSATIFVFTTPVKEMVSPEVSPSVVLPFAFKTPAIFKPPPLVKSVPAFPMFRIKLLLMSMFPPYVAEPRLIELNVAAPAPVMDHCASFSAKSEPVAAPMVIVPPAVLPMFVFAVPDVLMLVVPRAASVVNAPVDAELAPTVTPLMLPPVMVAPLEAKVLAVVEPFKDTVPVPVENVVEPV